MTTAENEFVTSYIFKDASGMKGDEKNCFTRTEEHFGVPWKIKVTQTKDECRMYLWCSHKQTNEWSIETSQKNKIMSKSGTLLASSQETLFEFAPGMALSLVDNISQKDYVADDRASVEVRVKILRMTGIENKILRSFDESTNELSDVFSFFSCFGRARKTPDL